MPPGSNDRVYVVFACLSVCHNLGHNFCNIDDSNLIFGMHVYLMGLHILSGERSRSRSSLKVKTYLSKLSSQRCVP
jgi:hypothetical protein